MFCKNCGTKIEDGMMFCPNCGEGTAPEQMEEQNPGVEATAETQESPVEETIEVQETPVAEETVEVQEAPVVEETVEVQETPATEETIEVQETPVTEGTVEAQEAPQTEMKFCPNCGSQNAQDDMFCQNCGFAFDSNGALSPMPQVQPETTAKKAGNGKKVMMAVGIAAAAVVVIGGGILVGKTMFGSKAPLLYCKDNEMNFMKGKKPVVIGDDIMDSSVDESFDYSMKYQVTVTEDKRYVFFPQDYVNSYYSDGGFKLYRADLNNTKKEPEKIESDVKQYYVLDSKNVICLKSNGKLTKNNLKESEKIASDVDRFYVSEDEKTIYYVENNADGTENLYTQDIALKKDKEKIASDVTRSCYISNDLTKCIYIKDENLYMKVGKKDSEKIASDVSDVYITNREGNVEFYYTKASDESVSSDVWVEDDLAKSDADMKEPDISAYEKEETYTSWWGTPDTRTVTDYDAYYADMDLYYEKESRDSLRDSILNYSQATSSLYFYKEGEGEKAVYEDGVMTKILSKDSVIMMNQLNMENVEKVKFSKIYEDYKNGNYNAVDEARENCFADADQLVYYTSGNQVTLEIDTEDYDVSLIEDIYVASEAGNMYFIARENSEDTDLELAKVDYKGKSTKVEMVADEVDTVSYTTDKDIYFVKDSKDNKGDLYKNNDKTSIAEDVSWYSVRQGEDDKIYFFTDYNSDKDKGTLNYINGKKVETVSDDVHDYVVNENGEIALIVEYSTKREKGDLAVYKNKKVKTVDTDVSYILYY